MDALELELDRKYDNAFYKKNLDKPILPSTKKLVISVSDVLKKRNSAYKFIF